MFARASVLIKHRWHQIFNHLKRYQIPPARLRNTRFRPSRINFSFGRSNSRRQMISGTVPAMLIQIKSMQVPHLKFVNKIQQVLLILFAETGIFCKGTEQTGKWIFKALEIRISRIPAAGLAIFYQLLHRIPEQLVLLIKLSSKLQTVYEENLRLPEEG